MEPLLINVNDLCETLSISRSMFFAQRSCGRIPLVEVRIGTKLLYRTSEVRAWVLAGCPKHGQWIYEPEKTANEQAELITR